MDLRPALDPPSSLGLRSALRVGLITTTLFVGATWITNHASRRDVAPLPAPQIASLHPGPAQPADPAELALANAELASYAFEAYPAWVAATPDRDTLCPDRLLELNVLAPKLHAVDPWGTPYQFLCGPQHGIRGLHVRSAGPDRRFDTADDLARP